MCAVSGDWEGGNDGALRRAAVGALLEGRVGARAWLATRRFTGAAAEGCSALTRELDRVEARERVAALLALAGAALAADPRAELFLAVVRPLGWRPSPDGGGLRWRLARTLVLGAAGATGATGAAGAVGAGADVGPDGDELDVFAQALDAAPDGPEWSGALAPLECARRALAIAESRGLPRARIDALCAMAALVAGEHDVAAAAFAALADRAKRTDRRERALLGLSFAHELAGRPRLALAALADSGARGTPLLASELALSLALCDIRRARRAARACAHQASDPRLIARLARARSALWTLAPRGADLAYGAARFALRIGLGAQFGGQEATRDGS